MPTNKKIVTTSETPGARPNAADAFALAAREIDAVDDGALVPINIDIPQVVAVVLGVLPGLAALRPEMERQLPAEPLASLDKLERYALAAWYAHLLAQPAASPVKSLLEEAVPLKAALLGDAEALVRRGYFEAKTVDDIRAGQGHVDIANDLVALSALFMARWPAITGRTAATEAEVKRAGYLGAELLTALGVRDHGAPSTGDAVLRKARAFTLFVNTYDEVRRAVTFLRWHAGDADELAPSLYKGRGGKAAPSAESEADKAGKENAGESGAGESRAGANGAGANGAGASDAAGKDAGHEAGKGAATEAVKTPTQPAGNGGGSG